jgi:hypothetical protein
MKRLVSDALQAHRAVEIIDSTVHSAYKAHLVVLPNALRFTCAARSAVTGCKRSLYPRAPSGLEVFILSLLVGLSGKREQVRTGTYQRAIPFDLAEERKHMLAQFSLRPYFIEVLQAPEGPLNGQQIRIHEPRLLEFVGELMRVVEVSSREVCGIRRRILVPTGR